MRRRGITLIEIMTTLALAGIALAGATFAFKVAIDTERRDGSARASFEQSLLFENRVRELLSHAYVSSDPNDAASYFHGRLVSGESSELGSTSSDIVVFTAAGMGLKGGAQVSEETAFEARNETFGPVGGPTEFSVSTSPVGDAGERTGCFVREQHPADSDTELGGFESTLDEDIATVAFEFFNGTDWVGEWNTDTERILPLAVRVTYVRASEEDVQHSFVVRIPAGTLGGQNGA